MFEKEAEEYVRKIQHDVINWDGAEPEERFYNEIKFKQAYQQGAEFGYNKANEWHFVKDEKEHQKEIKEKMTSDLFEENQDLRKQVAEQKDYIAKLEKENAVMKKKNSDEECLKRLAKKGYIKFSVKANEWHKQDIDDIYDLISKDWDIRYFICIMKDKSRVTAMGLCDEGCNGEVRGNLFFDHDDEINDEKYYVDDIVRWKEITLPKETKEDD